ncbi:MAG: glucose-6-phosphate dehydrogenase [Bacteroidota bacterium]
MKATDPCVLVIFGASGDLTYRKLIPSIYDLFCQGLLPDCFAVVGVGRSGYNDASFREKVMPGVEEFANKKASLPEKLANFASLLYYCQLDTSNEAEYIKLSEKLKQVDGDCHTGGNYLYYLATPPKLYSIVPFHLAAHGLNKSGSGWKRLIVEKPFGYDLETAKALNRKLLEVFDEHQLYRIDHYLGKETVQNLLVTRFANGIFEPLWNRNYINHIEITSAESVSVGDRGGYYDSSGALRDMVQNHLMQLLGMVAMEPPTVIEANAIRNEVLKVFQSLRPLTPEAVAQNVIRGQYMASRVRGETHKGYRQEKGVPEDSRTETYVAMKFFIDNWRWGGVPFYLRTGKSLPTRVTEVVVHFKETPHKLFAQPGVVSRENQLIIRIQPNEGILMKFDVKMPGQGFVTKQVNMDFHYEELTDAYVPSAYERLLLDAMLGDSTLFARGDAVEAAWEYVMPILDGWKNDPNIPVHGYPAGTWGPESADKLIGNSADTWRYPCKNLADDGEYCLL